VKHVLDKFRHKLPKEELKRLGKDIAKKLVASDYKNNRVQDPTAALSEKQTLKIKKYVKDFLMRAVEKYAAHQQKQAAKSGEPKGPGDKDAAVGDIAQDANVDVVDDIVLSDAEDDDSPSSQERKRKRESDIADSAGATPSEGPDSKRLRAEDSIEPSPPPPPPPPPDSISEETLTEEQKAEQKALREQEEALMRENEEAQRLEDEANKAKDLEEKAEDVRKDIALAA
jgi:histone-lysine N-methyltransferase SETD2